MSGDFTERLHNPNFEIVERHFAHPVPEALRRHHANHQKVDQCDFNIMVGAELNPWFIGGFTPIDENSVQFFEGFERFLDIADDGSEGLYFVDPTQADPEVFYFELDDYELTSCGCTLSEFLTSPRRDGYPKDDGTE